MPAQSDKWATIVTLTRGRAKVRWSCSHCKGARKRARKHDAPAPTVAEARILRLELEAKYRRSPASICQHDATRVGRRRSARLARTHVRTASSVYYLWRDWARPKYSPLSIVSYTQQWRTTLEPLWGDREVASITASEISRFRAEREDSWVCGSRRGRKWKVRAGGCSAVCGCLVDTCAPDCGCTCGCRQMDAHSAGTPLIVLNHVFTYAMRHGWLESNPCQLAKARSWQPKTRDNVLPEGFGIETVTEADRPIATVAAAHLLCERIAYPYQLIPLLACYAALRTSEIAGLCRWSVDVPGSRLYVVGVSVRGEDGMEYRRRQKGTTVPGRVVKIPTELMTLLKAHLDEYVGPEPGAYLWPTTCKRPGYRFGRPRSISANTINQQFAKARVKAGLDPALDLRSLRKAGKGVVKDAVGKEWAATWAGHTVEVAEGHYDAKVTQLPAEVEAAVQRAQEAAWEGAA